MKKTLFFIILICLFISKIKGQTSTEFWFSPPEVTEDHVTDEPINLRIATGNSASIVTITQPALGGAAFGGAGSIVLNIPANTQQTVDLTPYKNDLETRPYDQVLNTGLYISSTEPVTAYYELNTEYNPEIFALKGKNGLGTEFFTPFNTIWANGNYSPARPYTSFDIVATEDNTTVRIYPKKDLEGGHPALASYTVALNKGQTYSGAVDDGSFNVYPNFNPSGSVIVSDKPIAVSIKDDSANPFPYGGCRDLMGDQLVPVNIIGTDYIVTKGLLNTNIERVFITAVENNTEISVDGVFLKNMFAGETYNYQIDNAFTYISSSKPVYVLHISGFGCEMGAAILPSLNCAGSDQVSFVRSQQDPRVFALSVLVRSGAEGGFEIDGDPSLLQAADFSVVPGTGGAWMGAVVQYSDAEIAPAVAHLVTNDLDVFALGIINGGASSGCRFGYFSEYSSEILVDAGADQSICDGKNAILAGSVSGGAVTGQWSSSGTGTFSPNNTTFNATYIPSSNDYLSGSVTLTLTSTGQCFPEEDQMTITITPAPTSNAGVDQTVCSNNAGVTLSGAVTIATGGTWSGGAGSFNPSANSLNASYTPTAAEIASGTLTLTLTTTGNGGCDAVSDNMVINFSPSPTSNAGSNQTFCANNSTISLSGSIANATGGIWTGGGGSFNPSSTALNASYSPSPAELSSGNLTLTLTTTGNGNCIAVSDNATFIFSPSPVVNAGNDVTVCANNPEVNLNGAVSVASGGQWTGGGGSYSPNNTTLNAIYTPSAAEIASGTVTLTLTSTGNGSCIAESDEITITINPSPIVGSGTDLVICENNSTTSLNGSVVNATGGVWSGGLGVFNPSANALNATYTPTTAEISSGSLTLTLTSTGNGSCTSESDQVELTFTSNPIANAGSDASYCSNNASINLNGSISNATGGVWSGGAGSFNPSATSLNAVYNPTGAEIALGFVTLTLTTTGNGNCNSESDDVTFTFTPAPVVNAGTNRTVCANNQEVNLAGSVGVSSGGQWSGGTGTFSTSSTDLNAIYTPSTTEITNGTATLTLTTTGNGSCVAESDDMTITITPSPIVDAGADITSCSNNPAVSLNGNVSVATGGVWTGGAGTFNPSPNAMNATYTPTSSEVLSGSITLTLESTGNGNCNKVTDDVTITFAPSPIVDAGNDISVCSNNSSVNLNGSVTFASGGVWSGGAGSFLPNSGTLNAVYNPTPAEISLGSITLTLTSTGNGNCNAVSDQVVINFTSSPTVNAGPDQNVGANDADVDLLGSVTVSTGGVWTGGDGTYNLANTDLITTYTPTAAEIAVGSLTLTLTTTGNGNCNSVSDQILIVFDPCPTVNAGSDQTLCANNSNASLNGSVIGGSGGIWSGGGGTFNPSNTDLNATYTPSATEISNGSVTLTLTSTGNGSCSAVTDNVIINFSTIPTANAGVDQTICSNNSNVSLSGIVTVATGGVWTGGAGTYNPSSNTLNTTYTPSAAEITAGSVTLTLTTTGNGGCNAVSDNIIIDFTPTPISNAGTDRIVCANNEEVSLSGSIGVSSGGQWSGGTGTFSTSSTDLNAVYTPSTSEIANGTLTLTLTTTGNGNCNAVSDEITIDITPSPLVDAGGDITSCSNNPTVTLNGSVSVASGGVWTGGSGTFNPSPNTLNATYTPTSTEISTGSVTLILTSTGNGNCNAVSDDITITFAPSPVVDPGNDISVCSNNSSATLDGSVSFATGGIWSGGAGTFLPNNGTLNAIYNPTSSEISSGSLTLTLTSTGNGNCNAVSNQVTISFTSSPTVNAGSDQNVGSNNANTNLNGSISIATGGIWTGGAGTFNPSNTDLITTYTPTSSEISLGTLTLTLTTTGNGNCNSVSDDMTITFDPCPTVEAGNDQTVCSNNPKASLNGTVVGASGGIWSGGAGIFNPSNTDLNAVYTPTPIEIANGSVILTLTTTGNGTCNSVSDDVKINFSTSPTSNAGIDQTICSNNPDVSLSGIVTVATGGVWTGGSGTYNPSANALNTTYTPSPVEIANGSVTLTLTTTGNGGCNAVSDKITIDFTPTPISNAGADRIVCANNQEVSLSGSIGVSSGGQWSGGTGTFSTSSTDLNAVYSPSTAEIANGTLTLTLTTTGNGNCIAVSDEMIIDITPSPLVDAGGDITSCSNNPTVTLNGSVSVASGGVWTGGSGTFNPSPNTLNASYTPTSSEITAGSVTLTLTSTGNGNCNSVSDEITITFAPSPVVDPGIDLTVCSNNSSVTLDGSVSFATGGIWSGGAGTFLPNSGTLNAIYNPTSSEISSGSLTLTLTSTGNGNCNAVSNQVTISFTSSPTVNAGSDQNVGSNNANTNLNGSISIATGGIWTGGAGTFNPSNTDLITTYTPTSSEISLGTLTLTLTTTGNGNCNSVSDDMTITFDPCPTVEAGNDQTVCSNNPKASLNGTVVGASGGIWSGGAGIFNPSNTDLNAVYTPTPTEIANGSVILTLTTTGNGTCNSVSDDVKINFSTSPTSNAGIDQTICSNNPDVSLSGIVTVATGGFWTGGSGTYNPSANALNTTYTPSPAEIANGSVTLTLTTTGNGNCNAVSDNLQIEFSPSPVVDAGSGESLCANNSSISLNGSVSVATGGVWTGGAGVYSPDNTTLNATYTPTLAEIASGTLTLTLNSTGNGNCSPVADEVIYIFSPSPIVDAGADQTLCSNNAEISLNGTVSVASGGFWTGGLGTFNPSQNSLNATYTPTLAEISSGSLTLTLTSTGNGNCIEESDDVIISFTPSPTANAGSDQTVCINNSTISLDGVVTISSGGIWSGGSGVYNPSDISPNTTYTPTSAELSSGSLTLTLTTVGNGNCIAVSDDIELTFTPSPTINAGADQVLCSNNAEANLNGAVTVASGVIWTGGSGDFSPSNTDLSVIYSPTDAEKALGNVTLTLTSTGNGNCSSVSDDVILSFTNTPTVNAGLDQTVCGNNATISLNGSVTIAGGGEWSGGAGSFIPSRTDLNASYIPTSTEISTGSLTLTLTTIGNGTCNSVSDEMTITFSDSPVASAGVDQSVCSNNSTVTLGGSVLRAAGGQWSGGLGTFAPNSDDLDATYSPTSAEISSGSITLTLTTTGNGICNPGMDDITINFTPSPSIDAGQDEILCENNASINLEGTVSISTGGIWTGGNGTFNVDDKDLNAVYTPTASELAVGSLSLNLTSTGNGNCSAVTDIVTFTFTNSPVVDAGIDQQVCANNSETTLAGTITVAGGGIWSGGLGTFIPDNTDLNAKYQPSESEIENGFVVLTLTSTGNGKCNEVSDDVKITITPAPVSNAGVDQSICINNPEINLSGAVSNATGGIWSGGSGVFNPNNTSLKGTYIPTSTELSNGNLTLTLTTTGVGNCIAISDDLNIVFTQEPSADAGVDQSICSKDATVELSGSVVNSSGGVWTGGNGNFNPSSTDLNAIYTPTAGELANGNLTLTLTTTGVGNCISTNDKIDLSFQSAPTVSAGLDQNLCSNNPEVQLSGSFSIATGAVWSGGDGIFDPSLTDLNAKYTPTLAEVNAGVLKLTLSTTGNGICGSELDVITINFSPTPVVEAGAAQTICSNNPKITLNGSLIGASEGVWTGGNGTYSPSNKDLNATYTPTAAEIASGNLRLKLTAINIGNCLEVKDSVEISFSPSPSVNAGSDQVVCSNNSEIQLDGSVGNATGGTWIGGAGSFTPSRDELSSIYSPSQAEINSGKIILVLKTTGIGNCNATTDSLKISFSPSPIVNAGNDQELCSNNPEILLDGSVSIAGGAVWSGGNGVFVPDPTVLNATYQPTESEINSGELILTLSSTDHGNCNSANDNLKIIFTPSPKPDAGVDQIICANNSDVNLVGKVNNALGGIWTGGEGTYSPSNTALNTVYTPSETEIAIGSFQLKLTTTGVGNCIAVEDEIGITVKLAPVVDAGIDQSVCSNNPYTTLSGSFSNCGGIKWNGGGTFLPSDTSLNPTYTPTGSELALGEVVITLFAQDIGNCAPVNDEVKITYIPAPEVNAGDNVVVCENNSLVNLNGFVYNTTGAEWSGGEGIFSPSNTDLKATYQPSDSEKEDGYVKLLLTANAIGKCDLVLDSVEILITEPAEVYAGIDTFFCVNVDSILLDGKISGPITSGAWTTNGTGKFIPDTTYANAQYYIPSSGDKNSGGINITLRSINNGKCKPEKDDFLLSFNPAPKVSAGEDILVCSNNPEVLLEGTSVIGAKGAVWSTTGSGSFVPNNQITANQYIPTNKDIEKGNINLILTTTGNGNCYAEHDTINLIFTPSPVVEAGNTVACYGADTVRLNGKVNSDSKTGIWSIIEGTGSFSPDAQTLNAHYNITAEDMTNEIIILALTSTNNGKCSSVVDTVKINFGAKPIVSAGKDTTICKNALFALDGKVLSGGSQGVWSSNGDGDFLPNPATHNATYIPGGIDLIKETVELTFTISDGCIPVSDKIEIDYLPTPTVDAGEDITMCYNNLFAAPLNGKLELANSGVWSTNGNGVFSNVNALKSSYLPSVLDTVDGKIVLYLSTEGNGNCGTIKDSVTIFFTPSPEIDAGLDQQVCGSGKSAKLNGKISGVASKAVWTTSGNGYFDDPTVPISTYNYGSLDLNIGFVNLYFTTIDNGKCKAVSDTVKLSFGNSVSVDAGKDQKVCPPDPIVQLEGFVSGGSVTGKWRSLAGVPGIFENGENDLAGTYLPSEEEIINGIAVLVLESTNNGVCEKGVDTVKIEITPIFVDAGKDLSVCPGLKELKINGIVSGAEGGRWFSTGSGKFYPNEFSLDATYIPSKADSSTTIFNIILTSIGNGNCDAQVDHRVVKMDLQASGDFEVANTCSGQKTIFKDSLSTDEDEIISWNWDFGDGNTANVSNPIHAYNSDGFFNSKLIVKTATGCSDTINKQITIYKNPEANFDYTTDNLKVGSVIKFTDISVGGSEVFWDFGDGNIVEINENPQHTYQQEGSYRVELKTTSENNCLDSIFKFLVIEKSDNVFPPAVPTGFSPNGDEVNDVLYVRGGPFKSIEFTIFDEWGGVVFSTTELDTGWDGTKKGKYLAQGDYIYTLKAITIDGKSYIRSGEVTLIR